MSNQSKNVFFVSVRDNEKSASRKYSDIVLRLCKDALNENRKEGEEEFIIEPHDRTVLSGSDLRAALSKNLILSKYFIILLDDCNEDLKHRFNPNVLFECGVISTISDAKLTFIARENTNIPFDIGGNIRIVRIPANLFSCISDHFNDESFNADTIDLGCVSEIRRFKTDVKSSFKASDNPFIRDYELEFLAQYGFSSLIQFLKKLELKIPWHSIAVQ